MRISVISGFKALIAAAFLFSPGGLRAEGPAAKKPAEDWRVVVREFAFAHFKHPAWGYSHAVRIYQLAGELALADKAAVDDDVLYAAAYLHDMAAFAPWAAEKIDHADEAARVVSTVLEGTGFPMEKIGAVRKAISSHMYYVQPSSGTEALYLHDADALDWLGAIGAARVLSLVDHSGGAPDGPAAARMLESNLSQVPQRIFSKAGRALAPARKAELEKYLEDLRVESDNFRTL
jgi:HD superfamily phosphodiesterase